MGPSFEVVYDLLSDVQAELEKMEMKELAFRVFAIQEILYKIEEHTLYEPEQEEEYEDFEEEEGEEVQEGQEPEEMIEEEPGEVEDKGLH